MKKFISSIVLITMLLSTFLMVVPASAATVTDVATFNAALKAAEGDTTITISGTVAPTSLTWPTKEATVTVTGGTLDLSGIATLYIGCDLILDDCTVIYRSGGTIYADGNAFTVDSDVTVSYKDSEGAEVTGTSIAMTVYGGGYSNIINGDTNLNIQSGIYTRIYGGSNGGKINGNTNVIIGTAGNVNNNTLVGWSDSTHGSTYQFFGGSNGGTITGDTTITVGGYAYADYVVGGNNGGGTINGTANMYFSGYAYGLYGGSRGGNTMNDVNLVMTGGGVCDIIGASSGYSLGSDTDKSNVFVKIFGGEIRRRVYAGSYNDYSGDNIFSYEWQGDEYVYGTVTLIIGGNPSFSYGDTNSDRGLFACSRRESSASGEEKRIIFLDGNTYTVGRYSQDTTGSLTLGSMHNPSTKHKMTYAVSGGTITETCSCGCGHSDSIALTLSATEHFYTGSPIECASYAYGSSWMSGPIYSFGYENNVNVGTATAKITLNMGTVYTATAQFTILRGSSVGGEGSDDDFDYSQSGNISVEYTTEQTYTIQIPQTIELGELNTAVPVSNVGIVEAVLPYYREISMYVSSANGYKVVNGDLSVTYTMQYGDTTVSEGTDDKKLLTVGWDDEDNQNVITMNFTRTQDATGGSSYSDLLTFTSAVTMLEGLPQVNGEAFDTLNYDMGDGSTLSVAEDVGGVGVFNDYVGMLEDAGYALYTTNVIGENYFATLTGEDSTGENKILNVMYIDYYDEIRVVSDLDSKFDLPGLSNENTYSVWSEYQPNLTLVSGANIGWPGRLGYIYQLDDGSFFIIDGGYTEGDNTADGDYYDDVELPCTVPGTNNSYHSALPYIQEVLEAYAPDKDNIVIAAWFITHTHEDHFGAFYDLATLKEYEAFKNKLVIEQLIYNKSSDASVATLDGYRGNTINSQWHALLQYAIDRLENEGIIQSKVKAHPGQQFFVRNLTMTIYTTQDLLHGSEHYIEGDKYDPFLTGGDKANGSDSKYINNTSIVVMIDFMDKKALYLADSSAGNNPYAVAPIFGSAISEAQILQVAHHGYSDTDVGSTYELLTNLEVVFWPSSAQHFYGKEIGYIESGVYYGGTKSGKVNQVLFADGVKHYVHGNCNLIITDFENYEPEEVNDELQVFDKDEWIADVDYIINNGYK